MGGEKIWVWSWIYDNPPFIALPGAEKMSSSTLNQILNTPLGYVRGRIDKILGEGPKGHVNIGRIIPSLLTVTARGGGER